MPERAPETPEDYDAMVQLAGDLEADVEELLRGRELMLELLELYRENRDLRQRLGENG